MSMHELFMAALSGAEEVPPVRTSASGQTEFRLDRQARQLHYRLVVHSIHRMTAAHIHLGRPGENGPVVVFLLAVEPWITVSHGIVEGTITQADFVGPLQGRPFEELVRNMEMGNTYVNVHTVQNPGGEIRGQIRRAVTGNNGNNNGTNGSKGNNTNKGSVHGTYGKW